MVVSLQAVILHDPTLASRCRREGGIHSIKSVDRYRVPAHALPPATGFGLYRNAAALVETFSGKLNLAVDSSSAARAFRHGPSATRESLVY